MNELINLGYFLFSYSGGIIALAFIHIIKPKNTLKDFGLRLFIMIITAHPMESVVQHSLGWGDDFGMVAQGLGVFIMWLVLGLLQCLLNKECMAKVTKGFSVIVEASKWGKK
jgi:hypothetical protein